MKFYKVVTIVRNAEMPVTAYISGSIEAARMPLPRERYGKRMDVYIDWFDDYATARNFAEAAKLM